MPHHASSSNPPYAARSVFRHLIVHHPRAGGQVTSLCGFPLKRTTDGDLEFTATHFAPSRDIDLLWLSRIPE